MAVVHLRRAFAAALLALGLAGLLSGQSLAQNGPPVYVAPVTGIINPVQASYVDRVIADAERAGAAAVVLELDTPGGLDGAMRQIIQSILRSSVPVIVYVAPPGARAASAGVFITYAAHVAAMAPNTNIGSAHPVAVGEGGEVQMSDEMKAKVTNDAVAYIRGLAERRGRNADWAERAVRESVNVSASEAVQQHVVDLQASDVRQLLTLVDGGQVEVVNGTVTLHTAGAPIQRVEMNAIERLLHVISDPTIAYILLSLGTLGLILELSNPGQVLPGVVGGLSLLLAFYALGTLPVNFAGLLLIAFGFLLLVADVLSPTHGVLTVGGVLAFILGSLILFNTPDSAPFLHVSLAAIAAVAAILVAFSVFVLGAVARTRRRRVATGREALLGSVAEARTALNPAGYVHVEGALWRARAIGRPIEPGEKVRVVAMDGLQLTVAPVVESRPAETPEAGSVAAAVQPAEQPAEGRQDVLPEPSGSAR